jgi:hypothetical protein
LTLKVTNLIMTRSKIATGLFVGDLAGAVDLAKKQLDFKIPCVLEKAPKLEPLDARVMSCFRTMKNGKQVSYSEIGCPIHFISGTIILW